MLDNTVRTNPSELPLKTRHGRLLISHPATRTLRSPTSSTTSRPAWRTRRHASRTLSSREQGIIVSPSTSLQDSSPSSSSIDGSFDGHSPRGNWRAPACRLDCSTLPGTPQDDFSIYPFFSAPGPPSFLPLAAIKRPSCSNTLSSSSLFRLHSSSHPTILFPSNKEE